MVLTFLFMSYASFKTLNQHLVANSKTHFLLNFTSIFLLLLTFFFSFFAQKNIEIPAIVVRNTQWLVDNYNKHLSKFLSLTSQMHSFPRLWSNPVLPNTNLGTTNAPLASIKSSPKKSNFKLKIGIFNKELKHLFIMNECSPNLKSLGDTDLMA